MKKILLYLTFALLAQQLYGQACDNCGEKQISTDPREPTNCESDILNHFYWFPGNGSNNSGLPTYTPYGNYTLNNPFWANTNLHVGSLVGFADSDFYPEDGWEVIKVNLGLKADNLTQRNTLPNLAYIALYNKYTGIMRFLGNWPNISNTWSIVKFKVEILRKRQNSPSGINMDKLTATNLLSIQGDAAQPLDQISEEVILEAIAEFPGVSNGGYFFWFDIPVAFDPCICENPVALEMTAVLQTDLDIQIRGVLDGRIIQETQTVENYNRLVANRIIGAATATAAAIVSGGAVIQTSQFIGIVDIFSQRPGIDPTTQTRLNALRDMLNGVSTMVYNSDSLKWRNTVTGDEMSKKDWDRLFLGMSTFLSGAFNFANPISRRPTTTVLGNMTATGTATSTANSGDVMYWGAPGSSWPETLNEEVSNSPFGGKAPEYPLYNKPLGTFSLIRTPTVRANHRLLYFGTVLNLEGQYSQTYNGLVRLLRLYPENDLLYYINPELRADLDETDIKVSIHVKNPNNKVFGPEYFIYKNLDLDTIFGAFAPGTNLSPEEAKASVFPINLSQAIDSIDYISPPVPINQFREMGFQIPLIADASNASVSDLKIYYKFFIDFKSKNAGRNGEKVTNTQIFTFPVDVNTINESSFDFPAHIKFIDLAKNENGISFSNPQIFSEEDRIFSSGLVRINANLSTSNSAKVKIYSLVGFVIDEGVTIAPEIELITGYPFDEVYPQPMTSAAFVNSFCKQQISGLTYRANEFSASPIAPEEDSPALTQPKPVVHRAFVYPNPARDVISFGLDMEEQTPFNYAFTNNTGHVLFKGDQMQGTQTIRLSSVAPGVYFVNIWGQDFSLVKKVVVIR